MRRFREFLMEDVPPNPETTNQYHFDAMQRELGIDDDAFKSYLENGTQTLYKIPEYGWGFRVQPPVQATVQDKGNGQYAVTFLLSQKKLTNPKSFILPYKDGQRPSYYQGPVEDQTETMNQEELADLIVPPYESQANPMGGGMPPIGAM